jgi:hypothetical protein
MFIVCFLVQFKMSVGKYSSVTLYKGHAVVQLVEALRYNPEGDGFDSLWCQWNFSLT